MQASGAGLTVERTYWAFLSYSHADARWAEWLFRALESYAVPGKLVGGATPHGPAPRRLRPIFRDRDELAASANLGERLRRALEQSRHLIVICSPASARSMWVNEEIAYFRTVHGDDRILAVMVDGEPFASVTGVAPERECFPPALRSWADVAPATVAEHIQPIAVDPRPEGDGKRLALLKLVAGMLGLGLDRLVDRDTRRRQRQLTAVAASGFVGMAVMTGLTVAAVTARNEARAQQAQAEGLIEFMLGDVRKTLEPVGKLDALGAIADRAMAYYAAQETKRLSADSLGRRARTLHLLGEVADLRGDSTAALKSFREASASTGELLKRQPNDPQRIFDHAQSVYYVGNIALERSDNAEAAREFGQYKALADRLVAIDPTNDKFQAEVGFANRNLGAVQLKEGNAQAAADAFGRELATHLVLVGRAPQDAARKAELGQAYAWSGDAQFRLGRYDAAMADRLAERHVYEGLIARAPADADTMTALSVNRLAIATILVQQGRLQAALGELRVALSDAEKLHAANATNTVIQERVATIEIFQGEVELLAGEYGPASTSAQAAVTLAEALARKDPTKVDWVGRYLGGARVLQMRVAAQTADNPSDLREALANAEPEFERLAVLSGRQPHDLYLARVAAGAAILAGDHAALSGNPFVAREAWGGGAKILAIANGKQGLRSDRRFVSLMDALAERQRSAIPDSTKIGLSWIHKYD